MDLLKAITERRSIRKYRSDPVSDDLILQCVDAARLAPSWANTQASRFVVVKDRTIKEALGGALTPNNPAYLAFLGGALPHLSRCPTRRRRHEKRRTGYRIRATGSCLTRGWPWTTSRSLRIALGWAR